MQNSCARVIAARSLAALSGLALVGVLAGCSGQSLAANVTGPPNDWKAAPVAADTTTDSPTATASATPTVAPTTAASAPVKTQPVNTTPPAASAPAPTSTPSPSPSAASSTYKDGNYSEPGTYNSPGGKETLRVTVDLKNDVITDLAVTSVKIDSTAANYETAFEGGIQSIVVGKDIDSLHVGAVAGSSLTGIGFTRAITAIKADAKN